MHYEAPYTIEDEKKADEYIQDILKGKVPKNPFPTPGVELLLTRAAFLREDFAEKVLDQNSSVAFSTGIRSTASARMAVNYIMQQQNYPHAEHYEDYQNLFKDTDVSLISNILILSAEQEPSFAQTVLSSPFPILPNEDDQESLIKASKFCLSTHEISLFDKEQILFLKYANLKMAYDNLRDQFLEMQKQMEILVADNQALHDGQKKLLAEHDRMAETQKSLLDEQKAILADNKALHERQDKILDDNQHLQQRLDAIQDMLQAFLPKQEKIEQEMQETRQELESIEPYTPVPEPQQLLAMEADTPDKRLSIIFQMPAVPEPDKEDYPRRFVLAMKDELVKNPSSTSYVEKAAAQFLEAYPGSEKGIIKLINRFAPKAAMHYTNEDYGQSVVDSVKEDRRKQAKNTAR